MQQERITESVRILRKARAEARAQGTGQFWGEIKSKAKIEAQFWAETEAKYRAEIEELKSQLKQQNS